MFAPQCMYACMFILETRCYGNRMTPLRAAESDEDDVDNDEGVMPKPVMGRYWGECPRRVRAKGGEGGRGGGGLASTWCGTSPTSVRRASLHGHWHASRDRCPQPLDNRLHNKYCIVYAHTTIPIHDRSLVSNLNTTPSTLSLSTHWSIQSTLANSLPSSCYVDQNVTRIV